MSCESTQISLLKQGKGFGLSRPGYSPGCLRRFPVIQNNFSPGFFDSLLGTVCNLNPKTSEKNQTTGGLLGIE
jgi:hypothetical protein